MVEQLPPSFVWAQHSPGSVALTDMHEFFKNHPVDADFWEHEIIGAIHRWHDEDPVNRQKIVVADLGFGVGAKLAYICEDAKRYGLVVTACGEDLVPGNVYKARKKMATVNTAKVDLRLGDIRKEIPFDGLNFVLISEVAHWMTKDDFAKVMSNVSQKCTKGANIVVSYATPYNASALAKQDGSIDKKLVQKRRFKSSGYSHSCRTNMSWYRLQEMLDIGRKVGLEPKYCEFFENKTFPSIIAAGLMYRENSDYFENEAIRFVKV